MMILCDQFEVKDILKEFLLRGGKTGQVSGRAARGSLMVCEGIWRKKDSSCGDFVDHSAFRYWFSPMARGPRCSDAACVCHVLSRAVGRATLFDKPADYGAVENVLAEAH